MPILPVLLAPFVCLLKLATCVGDSLSVEAIPRFSEGSCQRRGGSEGQGRRRFSPPRSVPWLFCFCFLRRRTCPLPLSSRSVHLSPSPSLRDTCTGLPIPPHSTGGPPPSPNFKSLGCRAAAPRCPSRRRDGKGDTEEEHVHSEQEATTRRQHPPAPVHLPYIGC